MADPSEDARESVPKPGMGEIKLFVPEDLSRAFQRCVWVQVNETDRNQLDIMEEVVRDFLIKHGC